MQGQRGFNGSFSETIDIDEGSVSNNTGMSEQPSWSNILNPVQSPLSNYAGFPNEAVCMNGIGNDAQSSRLDPQNRVSDDGMKMELGWSSSFDPRAEAGHRSEERRSEPTSIFFPGRVNIGSSSNQVTRRPISDPNLYRSVQLELEHVGTSSGSSDYAEESNGSASSSLGSWGLSCKRKAGQSYVGGSSSSSPQVENVGWPTGLLSTPSWNSPNIGPPEHLNSRFGVNMAGAPSDVFPTLSVTGIAENPLRDFGRRVNQGTQQDSVPFNLSSSGSARQCNVSSPYPSPRPLHSGDSSVSRAATGQSHAIHVTGLSRNVHNFPWNRASNSRASSSSSTLVSGDRGSALLEEPSLRTIPRNNMEHPMFVPSPETRSYGQDPTSRSLTTGRISNPGGIPSSSRFVPSSSHIGHYPQFSSGSSASSQETAMSSRLSQVSQGHRRPHPRSTLLVERHRDDVLGPHSLRALAADIEGRHRLISEIRQVLSATRRGESLQPEDFMFFDPFIYHGMAGMHDRHRDMRLDVDNMSYEELLALEERIGYVSTGLSKETILKSMKQRKFISVTLEKPSDLEPCCICQEKYGDGEDVGCLDCGHDFHTNCIEQWLMQKNLCPICKAKALHT